MNNDFVSRGKAMLLANNLRAELNKLIDEVDKLSVLNKCYVEALQNIYAAQKEGTLELSNALYEAKELIEEIQRTKSQ